MIWTEKDHKPYLQLDTASRVYGTMPHPRDFGDTLMLLSAGAIHKIHGIELAVGRAVLLVVNDFLPWVAKMFRALVGGS